MKHITALVVLAFAPAFAAPNASFIDALHQVETSGRLGPILGDGGRALGPLQIHRRYWVDSRVPGRYEDCADLAYATRVVSAYLRRYAPRAWAAGDVRTLAAIHNGGPRGTSKPAALRYADRVQKILHNRY
jgi:hypothetical protein